MTWLGVNDAAKGVPALKGHGEQLLKCRRSREALKTSVTDDQGPHPYVCVSLDSE